ncbi:hypothetical protein [Anabaena sp. UHCC 0399]|uniref:hypothetical protein n=1 Tax=Anabaena sp. UHCC 0399 TaxID=3110238 RepID=UPI001688A4C1|nr:hypothetical protein [Anabaena sp. UHCC 0399]MBD2363537.1 hypothetical protein [Anabaena minutissima FACHB-250]MEA5565669.1 hypothetical protein [Anabaena sp. UHCC 0399]
MLEKLLLAVTITFALNLFSQVRVPRYTNSGASEQQHTETSATVLVTRPEK